MKEGEPTYIVTLFDDGEEDRLSEPEEAERSLAPSDSDPTGLAEWESEKTDIQEEDLLESEKELADNDVEKKSNPGNQEVKIEDLPF